MKMRDEYMNRVMTLIEIFLNVASDAMQIRSNHTLSMKITAKHAKSIDRYIVCRWMRRIFQ